jgi:hypothetical protein
LTKPGDECTYSTVGSRHRVLQRSNPHPLNHSLAVHFAAARSDRWLWVWQGGCFSLWSARSTILVFASRVFIIVVHLRGVLKGWIHITVVTLRTFVALSKEQDAVYLASEATSQTPLVWRGAVRS